MKKKKKKKTDDPSAEDVHNFLREILIMKLAGSHQNIVSIIGCCTIGVARPLLVVEYCSQGDLQTYLRMVSLNQSVLIKITKKILGTC